MTASTGRHNSLVLGQLSRHADCPFRELLGCFVVLIGEFKLFNFFEIFEVGKDLLLQYFQVYRINYVDKGVRKME